MSDLRKFKGETRKFEIDLTAAMSSDATAYHLTSIDATSDDLTIQDEKIYPGVVEFFVSGGEALVEYPITIKWRTSTGEDLEINVTLLVR